MIELPSKEASKSSSFAAEEQTLENHTSTTTTTREEDDHHHQQYNASLPLKSTPLKGIIQKKLLLLSPLLLCLYVLTDTTHHENYDKQQHKNTITITAEKQHLAFVTALSRHPPALRVFRIVSESAFLLFCVAFALKVWEMCDDENNQVVLPSTAAAAATTTAQEEDERILSSKDDRIIISIPSKSVGKLLFAPPPNSITDNAAWKVYKRHFRSKTRRKKRSSSSNSTSSTNDGKRYSA